MLAWFSSCNSAEGCTCHGHSCPLCRFLIVPFHHADASQLFYGDDCCCVCVPLPPPVPHLELLPNPGAWTRSSGILPAQRCRLPDTVHQAHDLQLHGSSPTLLRHWLARPSSLCPPSPIRIAVVGPGFLLTGGGGGRERGRLLPGAPAVGLYHAHSSQLVVCLLARNYIIALDLLQPGGAADACNSKPQSGPPICRSPRRACCLVRAPPPPIPRSGSPPCSRGWRAGAHHAASRVPAARGSMRSD